MSAEVERFQETTPAPYAPSGGDVTARELALIEQQAKVFARSSLVPDALKGKPDDITLVAVKGHALGIPIVSSLSDIHAIQGNAVPSARLRGALARREGHEVWMDPDSDATFCTWYLRRRGEKRVHPYTMTIEKARQEKVWEKGKLISLAEKNNWRNNPEAMLRACALRRLVEFAAQDVTLGIPGISLEDYDDEPEDVGGYDDEPFTEADIKAFDNDPATTGQKQDLNEATRELSQHQREWLIGALKHPSGRGNIVPNIDGPRFNQGHVRLLRDKIEAAKAVAVPKPGPSSEQIQETMDRVIADQQDEDPTRPFE